MYRVGDSEAAQRYFRKAIEISRACLAKKPDSDLLQERAGQFAGPARGVGIDARSSRKGPRAVPGRDRRPRVVLAGPGQANGRAAASSRAITRSSRRLNVRTGRPGRRPSASTTKCAALREPGGGGTARLLAGPERPRPGVQQSRVHAFSPGPRPGRRAAVPPQGPCSCSRNGPRPTRSTSTTSRRSPRRSITKRPAPCTRATRTGPPRVSSECLKICKELAKRAKSQDAADRSDARAGPLRRSRRGRKDRRRAGGDTAQG